MKPQYAENVFKGEKRAQVRRRLFQKWLGSQAVVYGTHPLAALMGEVTVSGVSAASPSIIRERFGGRAGCSYKEFSEYVGKVDQVYAIEFKRTQRRTYAL